MHILAIDIGNSRVKTEVWRDEENIYHFSRENVDYEEIGRIVREYGIQEGVVCSVRDDALKVCRDIRELSGIEAQPFGKKELEKYQVRINYKGNIGADRLAAYLGAENLYPKRGKLIVDAGTAMTTDVAALNGDFLGGNISLGLQGRLEALSQNTALLPRVCGKEIGLESFGHDTGTAIMSGAIYGMAGEILYAFERAKETLRAEMIIMTGGDAETLFPLIRKEGRECVLDPFLVGRGLVSFLRWSKEKEGEKKRK